MDDYPIFDGECHAIPGSTEYGYIAHKVTAELADLQERIEQEVGKYAEYLYAYDKEEVLEILKDVMRAQIRCVCTPERYQIVHRPPWVVGALAQYGTVCLKFKRAKKDNLDEPLKSCSRCC